MQKIKCLKCGKEVDRLRNGFCQRCYYIFNKEKLNKNLKCDFCGKEFHRSKSMIKKNNFCSNECYLKWKKTNYPKGKNHYNFKQIKTKCIVCGKEFYAKRDRVLKGLAKFCSTKCRDIGKSKKIKRICQICGREFYTTESRIKRGFAKFCSQKCMGLSYKKNYSDKEITKIKNQIRASIEYRIWRQNVFIKDNFTCRECGQKGGYLEAHHIKSFSELCKEAWEYLPLFNKYDACIAYIPMWDINNGITLCNKCHKNKYHGWRLNEKEN